MNKSTTLFIVILISLLGSCDFKDQNVDPNNITEDKLKLQNRLVTLQYYTGLLHASDIPKTISNTMGQIIYVQGNTSLNFYTYSPTDPSKATLWSRIYSDVMYNSNQLIIAADKENAPVYRGIARINYAMAAILATSVWGDVPYSEVLKPDLYLNPKFDTQEYIYQEVQKILDLAILDLETPIGLNPSVDDFIFAGNASKWLKVAHALKARYYLHLIKKREDVYDLAFNELGKSLTSNNDNALFKYMGDRDNNYHPLYNERGTQNTIVDSKFTDRLTRLKDPRLKFYSTVKVTLGKRSLYGPLYASKDSYMPIMTYEECLFMLTEINMHKFGKQSAQPILKNAIKASVERVCLKTIGVIDSTSNNIVLGIPDTSAILKNYISLQGTIDTISVSNDDAWKRIFEQKFIALFLQAEVWSDYRRTSKYVQDVDGLPIIVPREGTVLPRRYPYTFNETNYNTSTPQDQGIFTKNWWDVP